MAPSAGVPPAATAPVMTDVVPSLLIDNVISYADIGDQDPGTLTPLFDIARADTGVEAVPALTHAERGAPLCATADDAPQPEKTLVSEWRRLSAITTATGRQILDALTFASRPPLEHIPWIESEGNRILGDLTVAQMVRGGADLAEHTRKLGAILQEFSFVPGASPVLESVQLEGARYFLSGMLMAACQGVGRLGEANISYRHAATQFRDIERSPIPAAMAMELCLQAYIAEEQRRNEVPLGVFLRDMRTKISDDWGASLETVRDPASAALRLFRAMHYGWGAIPLQKMAELYSLAADLDAERGRPDLAERNRMRAEWAHTTAARIRDEDYRVMNHPAWR